MRYNWQQTDWPHFQYDPAILEGLLFKLTEQMGKLRGVMKALPEDTRMEAIIDTMVSEAIKTSEIEGEYLSREDVKSSIRNKLGLNSPPEKVSDKKARGAGELMVAVRNTFSGPLTEQMLFDWHRLLLQGDPDIHTGAWRTHEEPMQVVSGALGKQRIHFEAPPSAKVPGEMKRFIDWFNDSSSIEGPEIKNAPIRAALAHLYFESIHPFEDGNGRIGRAIAEKALLQGYGHPLLLSLSATIEANKKEYYHSLEKVQQSNDVTAWTEYFLNTVLSAEKSAEEQIDFILGKARFFDRYKGILNQRQLTVLRRMLQEGPQGFNGGMSARKYRAIAQISKATATRDMQHLAEIGAFRPVGAGRSARYEIVLPDSGSCDIL